ncbi:MAG: hypothetical protein HC884_13340 [Chloroflexaceae bacterium]|nr:hypothetical protein [Chloroflexaceae bacterium]
MHTDHNRMRFRNRMILALSAIIVLIVLAGIYLASTRGSVIAEQSECPDAKDALKTKSTEVLQRCSEVWSLTQIAEIRQEEREAQTRVALSDFSTAIPNPTPEGMELRTPIPPWFIPESAKKVEALDPIEFFDGPPHLRGSNSIWRLGAIPSDDPYEYYRLYLLARPPSESEGGQATLTTELDGPRAEWEACYHHWEAPQDIGTITIQAISEVEIAPREINGIVHFSTSTGHTGTLDLKTGEWQFSP